MLINDSHMVDGLGDGSVAAAELGAPVQEPSTSALVGSRLKRLRRMKHLTLQEVAAAVDLSHSFISMLERGRADISLTRLARLAGFYGVPLSELVSDEQIREKPHLVMPDDGIFVDRAPGITYRVLPIGRQFGIQVMHVRFEPHAAFLEPLAHDGDDFVWVTQGELALLYGDNEYRVHRGQGIWYPSNIAHAFRNPKDRPGEMISFTNPPFWARR
jgi:transcriptional regulator with XRE-family HTH domain